MEKAYLNTSIGKIEYTIRSGNPLIVFLNSFGSFDTAQSFSRVIKELPEHFGIFAPDYLNTGFSGKSTAPYTLSNEAAELAKIINGLNAEAVIVVAHSIGGVYALQMSKQIDRLRAFVGIEPTTREIFLNPPQEAAYLKKEREAEDSEEIIYCKITDLFSAEEAEEFWQTTAENSDKFDETANQNAVNAMQMDRFWQDSNRLDDSIPAIIVTESYRQEEYERSEYFNHNAGSKVVALGSFHYIQWEYPEEIRKLIVSL
ncbi:alpha/beta fold hydrolase [Lactobacillus xylocopicola]|uniref:AB hydrolase-1 domain-containing protein n=1 Tax=Lactobacillus xylocopicola TaxID=2976676 RepID=A0ABN6SK29_9LACO|nr:alpha/beta hydrolase [Lactobacillus xylocopicola]BDR59769.1 hypothetical protein KIM322_00300 [Lactobacillus xylocopicola]